MANSKKHTVDRTLRWRRSLGAVALSTGLLISACDGNQLETEIPEEPHPPEPTGADETDAVVGPGEDSTAVEGAAYPASEEREGYEAESDDPEELED